jgi:hypothetical protein
MRYLALSVALSSVLITIPAQACEFEDKACMDRAFLAAGGDPRELAEGNAAAQRFWQAVHCPPFDAAHPGRCDGQQDGPVVWRAWLQANQRYTTELRAAHEHACQLGYALPGTCN